MFPECPNNLACTRNGHVIYRVCNDPASPYYRRCVRASTCLNCKSSSRLQLVTAPVTRPLPHPKTDSRIRNEPRSDFKADSRRTPNLVQRAMSYAEAVVEWTAAGRPERSDEEVQRIYQHFCKPCKWFDARHSICRGCGCRVADRGFAIFNKIKMATQHCPRNHW